LRIKAGKILKKADLLEETFHKRSLFSFQAFLRELYFSYKVLIPLRSFFLKEFSESGEKEILRQKTRPLALSTEQSGHVLTRLPPAHFPEISIEDPCSFLFTCNFIQHFLKFFPFQNQWKTIT